MRAEVVCLPAKVSQVSLSRFPLPWKRRILRHGAHHRGTGLFNYHTYTIPIRRKTTVGDHRSDSPKLPPVPGPTGGSNLGHPALQPGLRTSFLPSERSEYCQTFEAYEYIGI